MKKLYWCGLVGWLALLTANAQVVVEVLPEQEQFLPGETLKVAVRVSNLSGQPIHLGADADWLRFSVESKSGFVVAETKPLPIQGEFTLESSKVAIKHVDLSQGFELGQPGLYSARATVKVKDWNQDFSGVSKHFEIVHGSKLWEQEFGVPAQAGEMPEVRKYVLQQANYLKQLTLYVRLTDAADAKTFKVFSIGPIISFSRPEAQVDKKSNLHVLWQTGAKAFSYRVINPSAELVQSQTYSYEGSRPRLAVGEQGDIVVKGGVRQPSRDDLPADSVALPKQ